MVFVWENVHSVYKIQKATASPSVRVPRPCFWERIGKVEGATAVDREGLLEKKTNTLTEV